jgi:methyl-accepting chemotaxis protein
VLQIGMQSAVGTISGMVKQVKGANESIRTVAAAINDQAATISEIAESSERSAQEQAVLNRMIGLTAEIAARATTSAELVSNASRLITGETNRIDETVAVLLGNVNAA